MISGPTAGEAARKDTARPISRVRSPEPDGQQFYDLVASEEHIQTIGNAPLNGHLGCHDEILKTDFGLNLGR